jgi:alkylhydroperoxidase/carboxymuconolactone decarboxylase family protein YurZ
VVSDERDLLRRLAAGDERSLRGVLAPTPERRPADPAFPAALDRRTRELVRLAALMAVEASSTSLRWAVELASTSGVEDGAMVGALAATAAATGTTQAVSNAPRLALALGFDFELDRWDES